MPTLRRVPIPIWLALLVFLVLGANELRMGGRERIEVVGAGPIERLRSEDAPPGTRYSRTFLPGASLAERVETIEAKIGLRPYVLLFGLGAVGPEPELARRELDRLMRAAENAAFTSVVIGWSDADPELRAWWRGRCRDAARQLCVDPQDAASDDELRAHVARAVSEAMARLGRMRATTRRGR